MGIRKTPAGKNHVKQSKPLNDFELSIPPKEEYLALVRQVTQEIASDHTPLDATAIDDFMLAVSEAATNAIQAQPKTSIRHPLLIKYSVMSDALKVQIIDRAKGFSPDKIQPLPEVTEPDRLNHEYGLGIYLYSTYSDDCSIVSSRQGTTICLVKFYPTGK